MNSIDRLYAGDFNVCSQEWQDDGSCVVTFYRHDDAEAVSLHIDELYGAKESVLVEVAISMNAAPHVKVRQDAAMRSAKRGG